jgi:membrane fusion protein (multidrug efflux system)
MQTNRVKIDFTVPETYTSIVQKGNIVRVQTNETDKSLTATIAAIEPQINSVTRNIKVRAFLVEGSLLPGTFVKILLDQNRKVIVIPTNAIIPDAFTSQVIVVKNNKGVFKTVETGARNADLVEITKGLEPGDSIVVSGILFVRPDATVKVRKVNPLKRKI